ncbi:putative quinol monooxygenase [Sphaerotilus uruguayifluvii]|uniref:Quinol monooxygenase YgiN n=1 Tax=Sphaerotilus uruguayifluvii TaxID=2735897 RepID=A0ABX2G8Y0_9BURK|nr:putative quinol monooxygenase [Leptothrix sp. C29]NRT58221.1 quinol monooxygenase YgiN [Leptothrix sp. C29]
MFVLLVELEAVPDRRESLVQALESLVALAPEEPGIDLYAVQVCAEDPNRFFLYEVYRDKAAWEAHLHYPSAKALLDRFGALLAQPPRLLFGTRLSAFARAGAGGMPEAPR